MQNEKLHRRDMLKGAFAAGAVAGFPAIIPASALGKDGAVAPSERVLFGVIGCGNRSPFAASYERNGLAEIVALADPSGRAIAGWKENILTGRSVREYTDFRELLASDVDAVHIAAGDYWHVPMALLAARAGKHVYLEKPLGLTIGQDLACREIAAEHKVQFQYGTQQRSEIYTRGGVEIVLNGHIGEVKRAYVFAPKGLSGGTCVPAPVPADLDYPMWLGPAPDAPYCADRCEVKGNNNAIFHVYDYAIGFVAGWGAHPYDQLQWWLDEAGLGMPVEVDASGTIPTEGFFNTVTRWDALLRYANGLEVRFCDNQTISKHLPKLDGLKLTGNGVLFMGSEGWLYIARGCWAASSPEILQKSKNPGPRRLVNAGPIHTANLVDAILGKNKTATTLESAIRSDICCHLTDLAIRHGGKLGWDAAKNTVTGNAAAMAQMHRPMRKPWDVLNPRYALS